MIAMYDGRCRACDGDIVADEHEIARSGDGEGWEHVDCDDAEGAVSQSTALGVACNDSVPDIVRQSAEEILRGGAPLQRARSKENNIVAAGGWCAPSWSDGVDQSLLHPVTAEPVFLATVDTACAGCGGAVVKDHHRVTDAPSGDTITHVECVDVNGAYFARPRYVPALSIPSDSRVKGLRDDRWGRYTLMSPDGGGKTVARSRASTVIGAHGDTYHLNMWMQGNVLRGAGTNPSLGKLAASLNTDRPADKERLKELVGKASEAGGGSDAANRGTALHAFCEVWETTGSMSGVPEEDAADVRAYAECLARNGLTLVPDMIERTTMTSRWDGIAGTFDNIYRMRDGRYVIGDKKTGKVGYDLAKMYGQFAMYAEGVHEYGVYNPGTGLWTLPDFDIDLNIALIIHLPAGTGTCFVYEADLSIGREHIERCARVRRERKETSGLKKVPYAAPARAENTDWVAELTHARSTYELRALFAEIDAEGSMTDVLKAVGNARWADLTDREDGG